MFTLLLLATSYLSSPAHAARGRAQSADRMMEHFEDEQRLRNAARNVYDVAERRGRRISRGSQRLWRRFVSDEGAFNMNDTGISLWYTITNPEFPFGHENHITDQGFAPLQKFRLGRPLAQGLEEGFRPHLRDDTQTREIMLYGREHWTQHTPLGLIRHTPLSNMSLPLIGDPQVPFWRRMAAHNEADAASVSTRHATDTIALTPGRGFQFELFTGLGFGGSRLHARQYQPAEAEGMGVNDIVIQFRNLKNTRKRNSLRNVLTDNDGEAGSLYSGNYDLTLHFQLPLNRDGLTNPQHIQRSLDDIADYFAQFLTNMKLALPGRNNMIDTTDTQALRSPTNISNTHARFYGRMVPNVMKQAGAAVGGAMNRAASSSARAFERGTRFFSRVWRDAESAADHFDGVGAGERLEREVTRRMR